VTQAQAISTISGLCTNQPNQTRDWTDLPGFQNLAGLWVFDLIIIPDQTCQVWETWQVLPTGETRI